MIDVMRYALFLTTLILASTALTIGCSSSEEVAPATATGAVDPRPASTARPVETAELAAPIAEPKPVSRTEETTPEPAGRQWKDPAGNVLAVGEFVSLMDGNVCLETPDGQGVGGAPRQAVRSRPRGRLQEKPAADPPAEEEPELVVEGR